MEIEEFITLLSARLSILGVTKGDYITWFKQTEGYFIRFFGETSERTIDFNTIYKSYRNEYSNALPYDLIKINKNYKEKFSKHISNLISELYKETENTTREQEKKTHHPHSPDKSKRIPYVKQMKQELIDNGILLENPEQNSNKTNIKDSNDYNKRQMEKREDYFQFKHATVYWFLGAVGAIILSIAALIPFYYNQGFDKGNTKFDSEKNKMFEDIIQLKNDTTFYKAKYREDTAQLTFLRSLNDRWDSSAFKLLRNRDSLYAIMQKKKK